MLRLLATLKFQDQAGTGTTKTNGKIGEVGTCTIESRAELVQESNRFAAGLEPKALEGVRITQRLRDYQQVLQYAARYAKYSFIYIFIRHIAVTFELGAEQLRSLKK